MRSRRRSAGTAALCAALSACTSSTPQPGNEDVSAAPGITRGCAQSVQGALGADWRQTSLRAGPVWFVRHRAAVAPADLGDPAAALGFVKVLVVVDAGADVVIAVAPHQLPAARLLYAFNRPFDAARSLAGGDAAVRLVACPDRSTQFDGGVISVGVSRLALHVATGATVRNVVLEMS